MALSTQVPWTYELYCIAPRTDTYHAFMLLAAYSVMYLVLCIVQFYPDIQPVLIRSILEDYCFTE